MFGHTVELIALDGITVQLLEFGMNKQKVNILLQPHVIAQRACIVFIYAAFLPLGSSAVDKSFGGDTLRKLQLKQEAEVNTQEFHQIQ